MGLIAQGERITDALSIPVCGVEKRKSWKERGQWIQLSSL